MTEMAKVTKNTTNKQQQLSFVELAQQTALFAYGPTKGTIFLTPNGYHLWSQMQKYLDQAFASVGVENVYFPSLIPLSLLKKEAKHVAGFAPELFLINKIGDKEIEEPLALRPTSEVLFCTYFQKVIKSYRHLPLLLNQWVNVWRWEQNANPFLRNTEFLWQEGHTLHVDQKDALAFCEKIKTIYKNFFEKHLFLPVFSGQKSEAEKFAGAETTWTLEVLLPDGQFLQVATVHYLGQNFTKAFKIRFLDRQNQINLPHQTSWGISTRAIAALVQSHRDRAGLVLPLSFAKIQVAILAIHPRNDQEKSVAIDRYRQVVAEQLRPLGVKIIQPDTKAKNFSLHYQEMELKGVPIRLEIGIQEFQTQTVTYVLRSDLKKQRTTLSEFKNNFSKIVEQMHNDLFSKAQMRMQGARKAVSTFGQYLPLTKDQAFEVYFCNLVECEAKIKALTQTVSRLIWPNVNQDQKCFHCQKPAPYIAIFGRSY